MLEWIGRLGGALGETLQVPLEHAVASVGLETAGGLPLLLDHLKQRGLVEVWPYGGSTVYRLTAPGREQFESSTERGVRFRQTVWPKLNRILDDIRLRLSEAENEEQFQAIGLQCREALIEVGLAVTPLTPAELKRDEATSTTDAKVHVEEFVDAHLPGKANRGTRKFAKAVWDLAVELQHDREATLSDAELCAEATAAAVNVVVILAARISSKG